MNALDQVQELVSLASPSHVSNREISDYIAQRLDGLGFDVQRVEYQDASNITKVNIVARRGQPPALSDARGLAYFAHSDVVPADMWIGPNAGPFHPAVYDDRLYGRGSCDMKGSIACMLTAIERLDSMQLSAPCYFVCTADEEVGYLGVREVVARSPLYREMVQRQTRVLIGEPTRLEVVYAHKGICGFRVTSCGEAAHSSTRLGMNANLAMIPFLQEMKTIHDETELRTEWQNDEFDPPTLSWNIGINDHTKVVNMKPARSVCTVFFRPLPGVDHDTFIQRSVASAERHGLELQMTVRGDAVYTEPSNPLVLEALDLAERDVPKTVSYGTDGGELSEFRDRIVCGPGDIAQAHTDDEWIALDQLAAGTDLFEKFLRRWCL